MIGGFNVEKIRQNFPVLAQPIIYLDSACMALKPKQVVEKMQPYYDKYTACAGRSAHRFAHEVETEFEKARKEIQGLLNAKHRQEVIFQRNTTEGLNLVANSFGLNAGDEVVLSDKEHNSNLLPWLKMRKTKGIVVKIVPSNDDNTFNIENFEQTISDKTKLVSMVFTSNMDGVTNPISEIAKITHEHNAHLVVDGAQAVPGQEVNVRKLDIDFMAFSGHKMLGPSGTGVLYGKKELLDGMDQFLMGGETVVDSTYDGYEPDEIPMKYEAGLQDYAGVIGLGEASRYLRKAGLSRIAKHEAKLNKIMTDELSGESKLSIIGPQDPQQRSGIFSFNIDGMDVHHVSKILDTGRGILTRSGAHCVHSWFNARNLLGSVRASTYLYNTEEEAQIFAEEVKKIIKLA